MVFGLNESTVVASVNAMTVPNHLAESFEGIVALGNVQAEKLYEEVINIQGEFVAKLQRGVSSGKINEACDEIFQEGALSNFITKVKEMFQKLWSAIKALFEKFMAWIDNKFRTDKSFLAKYKDALMKKASEVSDMEYKGHDWKFGDGSEKAADLEKAAEASVKIVQTAVGIKIVRAQSNKDQTPANKPEEKPERAQSAADGSDREEKIEAGIKEVAKHVGISNLTEPADIVKEFKEEMYGGSMEPDTKTGPNIPELIKIIENYSKEKSAAEKTWKAYEKSFNTIIKECQKLEKEFNKNNPAEVNLSFSTDIAVAKAQASLANQLAGALLTALKDRRDEARSILAKAITYKKK